MNQTLNLFPKAMARVIIAVMPDGEVRVYSSLKKACAALSLSYNALTYRLTRKNAAYEEKGLKIERVTLR